MDLLSDVRFVKGVGDKRASLLSNLGIYTVGDLLGFYPKDYEDRGDVVKVAEAELGQTASLVMTVGTAPVYKLVRKGFSVTKFTAFDESGTCLMTFFNQPYAKETYRLGSEFRFYGKVEGNFVRREMINPVSEPVREGKPLRDIVPVYPLTAGITQNFLRGIIKTCLESVRVDETLPEKTVAEFSMMGRADAVRAVHFPENKSELSAAKRRLAFDELLIFRLGLMRLKTRNVKKTGIIVKEDGRLAEFRSHLAFSLTGAQERCIAEIARDLARGVPMTRLVEGDVGSGKTAVAAAAMFLCVRAGYQAVMMAPTEILARQHHEDLSKLFAPMGISVGLLVSGMKASEKKAALAGFADGSVDVAVGTHALIEEGVTFKNAGLVVADEQHRFGVMQRAALADKGEGLHTLIMSATPIPRTLALIVYGDLDVSVLDELPPGRKRVDTYVVDESFRERINAFIRKLTDGGGQVYIVCPLVENADGESDAKDVESYAEKLKNEVFPDIPVAFIHGRMKPSKKDEVMGAFARGEVKILISTTVIEVGVNVPNAVLMIVENAERFGLSQLHQLRGRVGRGEKRSYCVLFSESKSESAKARLSVMARENDGFAIAKADLEQRGPGDFFGQRQHGLAAFKLENVFEDPSLIAMTEKTLAAVNAEDPTLSGKYSALLPEVKRLFTIGGSENIFN